jgi:hypothetical protein
MKSLESKKLPFIIYCHPYEFNPNEWKQIMKYVPLSRRLHQGVGRKGFRKKVSRLLRAGRFGTMSEVLELLKKEEVDLTCG